MSKRIRLIAGATGLLLTPMLALGGCSTSGPSHAAGAIPPTQPSFATYRCDEGADIAIANSGGMVEVKVEDADPVQLVAAPPGQRSRYGADGYALVLEDRDALWMKAGKAPMTCKR